MKIVMKVLVYSAFVLILTACGSSGNDFDDKTEIVSQNPDSDSQLKNSYTLLAWNDLGMHCMDGDDYSVFTILPPFNTLNAQLIKKGNGKAEKITKDVTISYEAVASLDNKFNTTSVTKTNFWDYAKLLFGEELQRDIGLTGNPVQSKTPHPLNYSRANAWWEAVGIPTSPENDDGTTNHYPMVKVVAKDDSGNLLTSATVVLPVSDEMDCKKCHSTIANNTEARPKNGYVNDANIDRDYKLNILKLHDDEHNIANFLPALEALGYTYQASLLETAQNGTPILCATCHKSNALGTTGVANIPSLTSALHSKHKNVKDPSNGITLDAIENRNACYACHPGSKTQCLRGAMGKAKNPDGSLAIQCQDCHGNMSAVGRGDREGWLDEPDCQSCHHDGIRETVAVTNLSTGTLRETLDSRFATKPNKPIAGKSLYRYSAGHEGVQCSACHGSTHAIYESVKQEDNLLSISTQGHAGTISECIACHTTVPKTTKGGPHGMHTVGAYWVDKHEDVADNGVDDCRACHGSDLRGSPLSKMFSTRILDNKTFKKGAEVSCYDCHGKEW